MSKPAKLVTPQGRILEPEDLMQWNCTKCSVKGTEHADQTTCPTFIPPFGYLRFDQLLKMVHELQEEHKDYEHRIKMLEIDVEYLNEKGRND